MIAVRFNKFHIIKAMSIRELTWQIKQVVLEAQNFTGILPSLRIFRLKTYETLLGLCPNSVYNSQLCNIRFIIGITFFKVSIKLIEIFSP